MSEPSSLPSRPKEEENPNEGAAPSKNAVKKAQKEKEKAEKAAKREQKEREEREERERAEEASDTAKHLYGEPPSSGLPKATPNVFESLKEGAEITVRMRVQNKRPQTAKLVFLELRKATTTIQAVVAEGGAQGISKSMVKWCAKISNESIVQVTGVVKAPAEEINSTTISNFELHIKSIFMISASEPMLPIQVKNSGEEAEPNAALSTRLNSRHLSLRAATDTAIAKLLAGIQILYGEHMERHKFQLFNPPCIVGAATEGGSGVFEIKYFERKAYLAQSPQFYKQMMIAGDAERVYCFTPVFRAEDSNTNRHLTEFIGLDFEMEIEESYHDVLEFGEKLMIFIIRALQTRPAYTKLVEIVKTEYPEAGDFLLPDGESAVRITFAEAKRLLRESGYKEEEKETKELKELPENDMEDINTAQEKALGAIMRTKYKTDFYTVDQYPAALRPFYTHPNPNNPELSNSFDFFMRGQEIMSGAQRIHDYEQLCAALRQKGLDPESEGFKYYTGAFKHGCAPHGGGGIGLYRILQYFLNFKNIRQVVAFPRDPQRCFP